MANKSYKGRRFEIEVATQLSLWWTAGERDDVFWHTHDSGGRATRRRAKGKGTKGLCGDICAVDPIGAPFLDYFCLELKKGYQRHTVADLLDKPEGAAKQEYEKWFEQAELSRKNSGAKAWLLIVKRDRRDALVFSQSSSRTCVAIAIIEWEGSTIYCYRLAMWLKGTDPEYFQ